MTKSCSNHKFFHYSIVKGLKTDLYVMVYHRESNKNMPYLRKVKKLQLMTSEIKQALCKYWNTSIQLQCMSEKACFQNQDTVITIFTLM